MALTPDPLVPEMRYPSQSQRIAIVGIACALPSGTYSTENLDYNTLWDFLMQKREAYQELTKETFNSDAWYGQNLGQINTRKGAFLKNAATFDHLEFGISLRDATAMSPSTRRLIELSFLALLDSGIDYRGRRVGCFMSGTNPGLLDKDQYDEQGSVGALPTMIANRVSYTLDITGPSISLDTACSSSMTATHIAIQSILAGDCEAALVGGCQYNHSVQEWVQFSAAGVLAPDGKCKPFDVAGNGFSRAEGGAVIVLKRYENAKEDCDHIYATILGSAINSTGGIATPGVPVGLAQQECIKTAYDRAGRNPKHVDYVELHATGTAVGDPVEANAAGELFRRSSEVPIGSIKGNLGHLEITAFLASLIKVCLVFEHRAVPPQANLSTLNPNIRWKEYGLKPITLPLELLPRDGASCLLASVSSSGIGGANGHAVLESPPANEQSCHTLPDSSHGPLLIMAGGLTQSSAISVGQSIVSQIEAGETNVQELSGISVRRTRQLLWRSFGLYTKGRPLHFMEPVAAPRDSPPVVFAFSGQGPQYLDMGRSLYESNLEFRHSIDEMDAIYRSIVGLSLIETTGLFRHVGYPTQDLTGTWPIGVTLPALAMFQVALVDMLASLGITPDVVLGHSAGETAMIYASKAGSKNMVMGLAIARGRSMSVLEQEGGQMAALACSVRTAEALVSELDSMYGSLDIACHNAPDAIVVSGDGQSVTQLLTLANDRGIWARRLRTKVPVHSAMMERCENEYRKAVQNVFDRHGGPCVPKVKTYSTLLGKQLDEPYSADYFWRSARNPVLFCESITAINHEYPTAVYAELSPHPVLSSYITSICGPGTGVICFTRRNSKAEEDTSEAHTFLTSLGHLCLKGYNGIDVKLSARKQKRVCLPPYPFVRRHVPIHAETALHYSRHNQRRGPLNFKGLHVNSATHPDLAQHIVLGEPIVPATGFLEMAFEFGAYQLRNVAFQLALSLSNSRPLEIAVCRKGTRWTVNSRVRTTNEEDAGCLHASGSLSLESLTSSHRLHLPSIRSRCRPIDLDFLKEKLKTFAQFGPAYTRIDELHGGQDEVLATVRAYDESMTPAPSYRVDPAILDGCLQGAYILLDSQELAVRYYLPAKVEYVSLQKVFSETRPPLVVSHIQLVAWSPDSVTLDVTVYDSTGRELCFLKSLVLEGHLKAPQKSITRRFEVIWQPLVVPLMKSRMKGALSRVDSQSLASLYGTLDQRAKEVILETLNQHSAVGSDISRQRYFNFMQRAAMVKQSMNSLLDDRALRDRWPAHYELTERVASVHQQILLSSTAAVEVLFKDAFMYQFYGRDGDMAPMCEELAATFREVLDHAMTCGKRVVRVLEIGTGTGLLTSYLQQVLQEVRHNSVEYVATDISFSLVSGTVARLGYGRLQAQAYDISQDPSTQGFVRGTFDIITGLHVLHAVPELSPCLRGLNSLLVPGGSLLFVDFDGSKWVSSPGTLWYDFVFGSFKEWFSFRDVQLRSHCTLDLEKWRTLLLEHGFTSVSICGDDHGGLSAVIHAHKDTNFHCLPSIVADTKASRSHCIGYEIGREARTQKELESLPIDINKVVCVFGSEGENGDALLGFGRSLRKEFPMWTIKLVILGPGLSINDHRLRVLQSFQFADSETDFYFSERGQVHVARITLATPPPPPDRRRFDPTESWVVSDGNISQTSARYPDTGEVLVSAEIWLTLSYGLRAFAGKVTQASEGPFMEDTSVVGITTGEQSNFLAIRHSSLARVPSNKKELQSLLPLIMPAAVAAIVNGLHRRSRRLPNRTRQALILGGDSLENRSLGRILSQLGWNVSQHAETRHLGFHRSLGNCNLEIIIGDKEAEDRHRQLLDTLSNVPIFLWDDKDRGLSAYLQQLNFGEDLEMVLEQADCETPPRWAGESITLPPVGSIVPYSGTLFRSDRTYLLLGGIGGLGIQIAAWMYKKGARYIALTSRSGEASLQRLQEPRVQRCLKYLQGLPDLRLQLEKCDSTSRSAMAALCSRIHPPVAGCMVMSLVLSDNLFMKQTEDSFRSVYESKAGSFRALAEVVDVDSLEFIIAFSSVAGLFGNAGQTNYAAACTAMDALAAKLRNAFTLIVPPITDVGYFARQLQDNKQVLAHMLDFGITCEELCAYIEDGILRLSDGPFTYQIPDLDWSAVERFTGQSPVFHHLVPPARQLRESHQETSGETPLADIVCKELQISHEDLSCDVPLTRYGLDSLSAARLSVALRPLGQITQLQLLSDITMDGIKRKLDNQDVSSAIPVDTTANADLRTSPIVKLRDDGTIPLIIVHGADGSIAPMRMLRDKYKGSLWAIQLTDNVPMTSLEDMATFYFEHIKLLRPHGPYHLGTFSGSTAVGVHLCKQFEGNGDKVLQLSFVDYFSTLLLAPEFDIRNALQPDGRIQPRIVHSILERMSHMLQRDGELDPIRRTLGTDLTKITQGEPSSSLAESFANTVHSFTELEVRFIRKIGEGPEGSADFQEERYIRWLADVRAPITVFWAKEGITRNVPAEWMEDGGTLDVRVVYPSAKVHWLEMGHAECLSTDEAAELLQDGWKEGQ